MQLLRLLVVVVREMRKTLYRLLLLLLPSTATGRWRHWWRDRMIVKVLLAGSDNVFVRKFFAHVRLFVQSSANALLVVVTATNTSGSFQQSSQS